MLRIHTQRGIALLLATLVLLLAVGCALAAALASSAFSPDRERASDRALAQAREALLAYATDRAIDTVVGPGYLPCPDGDGDGWAEATCGSLSGDSGQEQRLGRLPWKTLGLADLRDGHGERLWYAVSSKHKGLLNCAARRACVDMSPTAALGAITLRDASGAILQDGTIGDPRRAVFGGAVAVVLAPGAPVGEQRRECAAACGAREYLDAVPGSGEDNAAFHDRNDAAGRAGNGDGFIAGPVAGADGRIVVNDRVAAITYAQLMPRVMERVALEAALCLRRHAALAASHGRYPAPLPACGGEGEPPFGRLPEFPAMEGCNLALPSGTHTWWRSWQPHVFYAPAADGHGMDAVDASGRVIAGARRFALVVSPRAGDCDTPRLRCDAAACTQVVLGEGADVARAYP
jgi:hypothetical protein